MAETKNKQESEKPKDNVVKLDDLNKLNRLNCSLELFIYK